MEFIFTIFTIISSFLTDFLYKISLVNHLFIFDIDKKIISIKDKDNNLNSEIKNIKSEKIANNNISKTEHNIQQKLINCNIKKPIIKSNSNNNKTILLGREIKIPRKNYKTIKTLNSYFSSSSRNMETFDGTNKNFSKKDDISNNKTMNELDFDLGKEKEIKIEKKEIIDKIKINKIYFILCFICVRKRKNMHNFLLDEAIKIILEKLDILNIFRKIFKDEKIQEQNKNVYFIEMSEECKTKIKEYKSKKE